MATKVFKQIVFSLGRESKDGKKWRSAEVKDSAADKEMRKLHMFPSHHAEIIELIEQNGPGWYAFEKEKGEQRWKLLRAKYIGPYEGPKPSASAPPANPGKPPAPANGAAANKLQLHAQLRAASVQAGAQLTAALVNAGMFADEMDRSAVIAYSKSASDEIYEDAVKKVRAAVS